MDQNQSDLISAAIDPFLKTTNYTVGIALLNMLIAMVMGAFIAFVYRRYFQGTLFQKSYAVDLLLATMITCLIIMIISGNIILSLGMVGALSIVRFRTAVKDPSDTIYMFWAIAVGIGSGVGFHKLTIVASFAIVLALEISRYISSRPEPKMIIVSSREETLDNIRFGLQNKFGNKLKLRSERVDAEFIELVFDTNYKISAAEISECFRNPQLISVRTFAYGHKAL